MQEDLKQTYNLYNEKIPSGSQWHDGDSRVISSDVQDLSPLFEAINIKFPYIHRNINQWICDNFLSTTSDELLSHEKLSFMQDAEKTKLSTLIDTYRDLETVEEDLSNASDVSSLSPDDADETDESSGDPFTTLETNLNPEPQFCFSSGTREGYTPANSKLLNATVYPLITCSTQKQGFKLVEQRITREEHIEKLCNSTEDGKLLYYDESNCPFIKFEKLKSYKINLIGILGKKNEALKFLKLRLSEESLEKVEKTLDQEKSGLFLITPLLESGHVSEAYLYFNSENDQDYQSMNSRSRAIHFMRYMTDLTRNILFLLNKSDEKMLSSKKENVSDVKDRVHEIAFRRQQEEKIEFSESDEGAVPLTEDFEAEQCVLFGSNNGLTVAKRRNQGGNRVEFVDMKNFLDYFQLSQIEDPTQVDVTLMKEFLRTHHKSEMEQIQINLQQRDSYWKQMKEDAFPTTSQFIRWIKVLEKVSPSTFGIIDTVFEIQNHVLWKNCRQSQDIQPDVLTRKSQDFRTRLQSQLEKLPSFILKWMLQSSSEDSFQQLFGAAQRAGKFGVVTKLGYTWKKESWHSPDDANVVHVFRNQVRKMSIESPDKFKELVDKTKKLLEHMKNFARKQDMLEYKTKMIQQTFENFRQVALQKSHEKNSSAEKQIKRIRRVSMTRYRVEFNYAVNSETKLPVELLTIEKQSGEAGELHGTENPYVTASIKLELPECKIIRVFQTDCDKLLVVCNQSNGSFFSVFDLHNQKIHIQSSLFRSKVSQCDFNSNSRFLCLLSEELDKEMSLLITYSFDEGYSSCEVMKSTDLRDEYGVSNVGSVSLHGATSFIWIVFNHGRRLLKLNLKTGAECEVDWVTKDPENKKDIHSIIFSRNGKCAILKFIDGSIHASRSGKSEWQKMKLSYKNSVFFDFQKRKNIINAAQFMGQKICIKSILFKGVDEEILLEDAKDRECGKRNPEKLKHWIHNFAPLYHKFPCQDRMTNNSVPINFVTLSDGPMESTKKCISATFKEIEREVKDSKKPMDIFKKNNFTCIDWDTFVAKKYTILFENDFERSLGDLIEIVIALTPVQIARCQSNSFNVLRKGEAIPTNVQNGFQMKDKIYFGLVETVIRNWRGPIRVVSTMGKQTTGKSYLLNHLFGASFDISGARCTDGCWMVAVCTNECLYILLDFEGLGSFERTDQDDMLLSIFNSALSNVTLFKSEKVFDRATDRLFCKFNAGSKQLDGLPNSFTGKFVMIINDVPDKDEDEVYSEFKEKLGIFLSRDSKKCFLNNLYKEPLGLRSFAMFGSKKFYQCIEEIHQTVLEIEPKHDNGQLFLETMKLLMAKLAVDDFTPFKKQFVESRIRYLQKHLIGAVLYGEIVLEGGYCHFPMTILDQSGKKIDTKWSFQWDCNGHKSLELTDSYQLSADGLSAAVSFFSKIFTLTPSTAETWRQSLESFITAITNTRFSRVNLWLQENLSFWKNQEVEDYNDSIATLMNNFEHEKQRSSQTFKLCGEKCSNCFLDCTLISNHSKEHCCSTNHKCPEACCFCKDIKRDCEREFGHRGKHHCGDTDHTCGEKCSFSTKNQCKFVCSEPPDHEDDHSCDVKIHTCIETCSHPDCQSTCFIECSQPHTIHKCSKNTCIHLCSVKGCGNMCVAQNHFHGNQQLTSDYRDENPQRRHSPFYNQGISGDIQDHFCDQSHICPEKCEHEGYCSLSREKFDEEEFVGQQSTFTYEKKFVSIGLKDPCIVQIMPFKTKHDSKHRCSLMGDSRVHTCLAKCKQCDNLCTKPHGHTETDDKLHHTSHGNMYNYNFISTSLHPFVYGKNEYVAGDSCKPFYCHILCNMKGRGHIHVTDCPGECEQKFSIAKDGRRHNTYKYQPDEERQRDEVWHKQYWENVLGFEDPCSAAESFQFNKCPFKCKNEIHDEDNPSYCILDLWHPQDHVLQCEHGY